MDEQEKIEQRQRFRLFLTEVFMSVSVIFLVGFLSMLVMGYSFHLTKLGTEENVVERTGLAQISSIPTGATISLDDGSPLLLRTNTSRTLSSGAHKISLTKDGYDSWSKTITISEGMMYRLNYPRLFLTDRIEEPVFEQISETFVSATPNGEKLLLFDQKTKLFSLVDISTSKPTKKSYDFLTILNLETVDSLKPLAWSGNNKKLLINLNNKIAVLDLDAPSESLIVNNLIDKGLLEVEFETGSGERLILLSEKGELFELDLKTKVLSDPLTKHVVAFDNNEDKLILLSNTNDSLALYSYRVGDEDTYLLRTFSPTDSVKFAWATYFQSVFFAISVNSTLEIYSTDIWPEEDLDLELIEETSFRKLASIPLGFTPSSLRARGKGMFFDLTDSSGSQKAVFDLEAEALKTFEIKNRNSWIDEFLRFEINDAGELWVTDYDGENWHILATGLSPSSPVILSKNNKYLYYFKSSDLYREKIN